MLKPAAGKGGLRVVGAQARVLRAALRTPFRIATGQHDTFENVFLRLQLENGSEGWGEAGVARHITGETIEQTLANLELAAERLAGRDLHDYRGVCASFERAHRGNPAAQAALEMAVLDVVARSCDLPFWKWFGNRVRPCRSDITIVIGSVREAALETRKFFLRGFRSFKIKIGRETGVDLARIEAVSRNAPRCSILLDANQGFSASEMLQFLKALRRAGVRPRLVEQPVPCGDWEGLAKLTRESGVPICADESVRSLADAVTAVRAKAVNVVNLKLAKTGLWQSLEIARLVQASGLRLMIGAMMESALSITAAAHFAAGFGGIEFVDLDTTFFIRGPLSRSPYLDDQGRFDFSSAGPGIGVIPKPRSSGVAVVRQQH